MRFIPELAEPRLQNPERARLTVGARRRSGAMNRATSTLSELDVAGCLERFPQRAHPGCLTSSTPTPIRFDSRTHRRPRGPEYSDCGRMMRFVLRCSTA